MKETGTFRHLKLLRSSWMSAMHVTPVEAVHGEICAAKNRWERDCKLMVSDRITLPPDNVAHLIPYDTLGCHRIGQDGHSLEPNSGMAGDCAIRRCYIAHQTLYAYTRSYSPHHRRQRLGCGVIRSRPGGASVDTECTGLQCRLAVLNTPRRSHRSVGTPTTNPGASRHSNLHQPPPQTKPRPVG